MSTPTLTKQDALRVVADYVKPAMDARKIKDEGIIKFAESDFWLADTRQTISLLPHQKLILSMMFEPEWHAALGVPNGFVDYIFSTVKKSGKTTIAGLIARWVAEKWGFSQEVYCLANDEEQARGRIYQKIIESITSDPAYDLGKRVLPGRWRIIERDAKCLTNDSIVRAVSTDYKGEAGSNPTATIWSELWGYTSETSRRLWAELTPVPTRARSIRLVETYAGFKGESKMLWNHYELGISGRRLTIDDVPQWAVLFPGEDQLPIWVNERARMFTYWDTGETARRMVWQTPAYYIDQSQKLTEAEFDRLHNNFWVSPVSDFIPVEWWDRQNLNLPINHAKRDAILAALHNNTLSVVGADASVTSDCTALVRVIRNPLAADEVVVTPIDGAIAWKPVPGVPLNYDLTIRPTLEEWCRKYNVVQVAYDAYQLHYLMTQLREAAVAWCKPFSQNASRNLSDKQLYDLIRDRKLWHFGDAQVREHIEAAAGRMNKDENTKLRIVKKADDSKIDLVICLSMATFECLRLNM